MTLLQVRLFLFNALRLFADNTPANTTGGNLQQATDDIARDIVQFIAGGAAGVAAIALAVCGIGIIIGSDWGQKSKKHIPYIFIGMAICALVWVIITYFKSTVARYGG